MPTDYPLVGGQPGAGTELIAAESGRRLAPLDEQAGGGGPNLRRLVAAVLRQKWLAFVFAVVGTIGGVVASRFMKPKYVAEATIWIAMPEADKTGPIRSSELFANNAWLDLLQSYAVLDSVVSGQHLYVVADRRDRPAFTYFELANRFAPGKYELHFGASGRRWQLTRQGSDPIDQGSTTDSIGRKLGFRWVLPAGYKAPGRTIRFKVMVPRDAARDLAKRLGRQLPENGNFLHLSLEGEDPEQTAAVVNAVADRYIAVAAELKGAKQRELANILGDQLASTETALRNAETELENFRVHTITLPSEAGAPVTPGTESTRPSALANFFNLKVEKENLRNDQNAIRQALAMGRDSTFSIDALASVGAVSSSPELQQAMKDLTEKRANLRALRQRFTDEHPQVQKALADVRDLETQIIPRLARGVMSDLATRERALDALIGNASQDLQGIPPRAIVEARLRRQVDVAATLYTGLQQRYSEAKLAAQSSTPDIRLLDRAVVPSDPVSDRRLMVILLGLLAGIGAAVATAIVADRLDPRVRYPEQVTAGMRLTILGAVPYIRSAGDAGARGDDLAPVLEAIRGIRLNLVHAYGAAGPLVVTISSVGSGDGKSLLTSNLALAFADLGQKTLVIDGDIRRGTLHRLLSGVRRPGLTDFLSGQANLEQVLQSTPYPFLHLIGSGSRMHEGPELLGSPAMRQLLTQLRSRFSVILVDSPPLTAGVDPYILGTVTGNMVLVLRTGRTDRSLAEAKLDMLDRLPVRVLGAVLNGVQDKANVYRHYSYLPHYEVEAESGPPPQLEAPVDA